MKGKSFGITILIICGFLLFCYKALTTHERPDVEKFRTTFDIGYPWSSNEAAAVRPFVQTKIDLLEKRLEDKLIIPEGVDKEYGELKEACRLAEDANVISEEDSNYPSACRRFTRHKKE